MSAPNLPSAETALDQIVAAIEKAGYRIGDDVMLALDPAASEFFSDGAYRYKGEGKTRSIEQQVDYLAALSERYPIVSIEDGMAEDDVADGRCSRSGSARAASSSAMITSLPMWSGSKKASETASPIRS